MKTVTSTVQADSRQLVHLLNRALNTLDPKDTPQWAIDLADEVRTTDSVVIKVTRQVKTEEDIDALNEVGVAA